MKSNILWAWYWVVCHTYSVTDRGERRGPPFSFEGNFAENTARQLFLVDNFVQGIDPYITQPEYAGVSLRPHQGPALAEVRAALSGAREPADRCLLWPAPPNFGKSTMAALAVLSSGIGRCPPGDSRPLKGLIFIPRDVARRQIIDTCRQFAPSVRVKGFVPSQGRAALEEADVLALTYKGCVDIKEADWRSIAERTDLWILDEVHRGLGERIAGRLREGLAQYRPTALALSATPDFSEDRKAADVLQIKHTLKGMTPREAIACGVANSVQLIAVSSGASLHFGSKRRTITEEDTNLLIENDRRNRLITAIMRDMGSLGIRGLVHCVPGMDNKHPELIAKMARERTIVDPISGLERALRVEAVGFHKSNNEELIARFKYGKGDDALDALTFSRYLIEAFDCDHVRYIIASTPSTSEVDMGQLVGRGARLGDPRITRLFCIVDRYTSGGRKELKTPFHVFGEDDFYQGMIIRPASEDTHTKKDDQRHGRHRPDRTLLSATVFKGYSREVFDALASIPPGTVLSDLLVVRNSYNALKEPPPGYVRLADVPVIAEGRITMASAAYALKGRLDPDGQPALVNVAAEGIYTYISPWGNDVLEQRYRFGAVVTRREIQNFLEEHGWPVISFDGLVSEVGRAEVTFQVLKKNICFKPAAAAQLLHNLVTIPLVDPDKEVLLGDLKSPLLFTNTREMLKLLREGDKYAAHMLTRRRTKRPQMYDRVNALTVEGARMFAAEIIGRSRKGLSGDPNELVARAQQDLRQYMWDNKLRPTIAAAAIDAFIEGFSSIAPPSQSGTPYPPSPLLDESFYMSGYGKKWQEHAQCQGEDPSIFISEEEGSVAAALAICNSCDVKGDCLLASLRQDVEHGTIGGLPQDARLTLLPVKEKVIDWLKRSERP